MYVDLLPPEGAYDPKAIKNGEYLLLTATAQAQDPASLYVSEGNGR